MSMSSNKPLMLFSSDAKGTLTSPSYQLWDNKIRADMDRFVEDGSLVDNVESFLSHDDTDPRDAVGHCMDVPEGFTFIEIGGARASSDKVVCCHFSSDGKLLATGGHDKKNDLQLLSVNLPLLQTRTVKVSNISLSTSQHDMIEFFSFSGEIGYVEMKSESQESQIAYVTFRDKQGAETSVLLSGANIADRSVTVAHAVNYQLPPEACCPISVLTISHVMVVWQPVGISMGVFDMCHRYLKERK